MISKFCFCGMSDQQSGACMFVHLLVTTVHSGFANVKFHAGTPQSRSRPGSLASATPCSSSSWSAIRSIASHGSSRLRGICRRGPNIITSTIASISVSTTNTIAVIVGILSLTIRTKTRASGRQINTLLLRLVRASACQGEKATAYKTKQGVRQGSVRQGSVRQHSVRQDSVRQDSVRQGV